MIPLNQISVATPCHESWDEMTGDDKKRFCAGCKKHVYNLSAMTEAEAQEVLNVGRPCVRFYRRLDGTLLTKDCPVGVRRVRLKMAAAISGAAAGLLSAMAGRQVLADSTVVQGGITAPQNAQVEMGDVAVAPRPTMGEPMMGKVAAPVKPGQPKSDKHSKHHKKPATKASTQTGQSTIKPPLHPPPVMMGIVAFPPQHVAPKPKS